MKNLVYNFLILIEIIVLLINNINKQIKLIFIMKTIKFKWNKVIMLRTRSHFNIFQINMGIA